MKKFLDRDVHALEISKRVEGVRVGKIVNVDERRQVFVDFPGNKKGPIAARFTNSINLKVLRHAASAGQDVLLVFENNDSGLPIIIDTLTSLLDNIIDSTTISLDEDSPKDVLIHGKRVTFDAREEIVLRCGKASITLTRAGRVVIRGAHVLNRSSGVNRIQGGSVRIN